ncbi:MAG: methyltransferase domain-containing protein [Pseudomonadota bacterium]
MSAVAAGWDGVEGAIGLLLRLRAYGILDETFLTHVEKTPHEHFLLPEHARFASQPFPFPIPCGQTAPSPDVTIRLLDAARLHAKNTVLEIGTGSGYQTALMARMTKKVHSIERYVTLISRAKNKLAQLQLTNVTFEQADGVKSDRNGALYDRIVCDMAFEEMPRFMLDSLASGGIAVTAIGPKHGEQMAVRLMKIGSRFEREDLFPVRFASPESGIAKAL